nr:hypothetical protein B0A51_08479 [Rachicladosporium sp. CCFEE 5018]
MLDDTRMQVPAVQVFVFGRNTAIPVYKLMLAAASARLAKLCVTGNGTIKLQEGAEALHILLGWVLESPVTNPSQLALAEAWTLGQKFQMQDLQKVVFDALRDQFHKPGKVCHSAVTAAYRQPDATSIQKILVHQIVKDIIASGSGNTQRIGWNLKEMPCALGRNSELMRDLANEMGSVLSRPPIERTGRKRQAATKDEGDDRLHNSSGRARKRVVWSWASADRHYDTYIARDEDDDSGNEGDLAPEETPGL